MNSADAIRWFKTNFQPSIESAVAGTPFTLDLVTAIACQETGYIWQPLADRVTPAEVLKLCVGDTIGEPRRGAFPATKNQLLRANNGPRMFAITRGALQAIAEYDGAYAKEFKNPDEFCHGFGIFQYDLQFFVDDPEFFLEKQWYDFDACLARFLKELNAKLKRVFGSGKTSLSRREMASLAIAYNTGSYREAKGLQQGHRSPGGKFYGEKIFDFLGVVPTISIGKVIGAIKKIVPLPIPLPIPSPEPPAPRALPVKILRSGDKGELVKVLQTLLQSQGYFSGAIGGNFLEKTRQAVVYFQQTHLGPKGNALEVDGEVGPDTWWALFHPSGAEQRSHLPSEPSTQLTPLRTKVLAVAAGEHQAGVREDPDGSNWGDGVIKYLKDAGSPGDPWCCFFWSWCVKNAGGQHPFGGPMGHVLTTWKKAQSKGWARDKADYSPIPGDAFVMLYRNSQGKFTGTGHIGFVLRVDKTKNAKSFNTVEGNCGNRVKVGVRQMKESTLVGFINQYPADEQPVDWETGLVAASDVGAAGTR